MSENGTRSPRVKRSTARRNAEEKFAALERRNVAVRSEMDEQLAAATAKTAKLRTLRLAKEEIDRLAAANAPASDPNGEGNSNPT